MFYEEIPISLILKTENLDEIRKIRTRIFHIELGLSQNDIFDNDDKVLDQFLILNEKNYWHI